MTAWSPAPARLFVTTDWDHREPITPNLLARDLSVRDDVHDSVWVSAIMYVHFYLAVAATAAQLPHRRLGDGPRARDDAAAARVPHGHRPPAAPPGASATLEALGRAAQGRAHSDDGGTSWDLSEFPHMGKSWPGSNSRHIAQRAVRRRTGELTSHEVKSGRAPFPL